MKTTMNNKMRMFTAVFISSVVLAGCMSTRDQMVEQGYPLAYADGYDDGCHSGNKAGGSYFDQFKKDVPRFNTDKDYAQGWADAFRQCKTEQESIQRQIRINLEQQKLTEQKKQNDWEEQKALEKAVTKDIDTEALNSLSQ